MTYSKISRKKLLSVINYFLESKNIEGAEVINIDPAEKEKFKPLLRYLAWKEIVITISVKKNKLDKSTILVGKVSSYRNISYILRSELAEFKTQVLSDPDGITYTDLVRKKIKKF